MKLAFAFCIAATALGSTGLAQEAKMDRKQVRLLPTPQQLVLTPTLFRINAQTRIILGEGTREEDLAAVEAIVERIADWRDAELKVVKEAMLRKLTANFIFIGSPQSAMARQLLHERGGKLTAAMRQEGYFLDVRTDGVVIIGESVRGRYYGATTLLQLIERQKKSIVVPGITIHDWPQMKVRGITDDISRGQISTLENFKAIIRFLSRHKLNTYALYLEDMFVFKNHPLIGKNRGALTPAEVKELDRYARRHHVELIPIFQTLGHWENILSLPEYVSYAEFPGAHTLNVSDPRIYKLLDEMIGEVAAAFSSPYFHIGADESWDVGLGASRSRVDSTDVATVHAEHYRRVFELVKKHRKKPMMYGDILLDHPSILDRIPKDVVIVDWHYGASDVYPSPAQFRQAGFPFIVSPSVWNFTGPFPNYVNAFVNIRNLGREGFRNGALGMLTSNWNDHGGEALRELNYYGYAWTAECAWRPGDADVVAFDTSFFPTFFGSDAPALQLQSIYALLSNPLNQTNWHELRRHPLLPPRESPLNLYWRIQSLEASMPLVRALTEEARSKVSRHEEHLQYLDYVARLNLWFAQKLRIGGELRQWSAAPPDSARRDSVRRAAKRRVREAMEQLSDLRDEFRRLWMKTNRLPLLDLLTGLHDRQIGCWQEIGRHLEAGVLWFEPSIESEWIYHPLANPRSRDSAATQVPRAFFRTTFTLEEIPAAAPLQLIADTHARLWVNGQEVGAVMARRSLSLSVELQRVRVWDVASRLQKGSNTIAVEVTNYDRNGSAGVNVFAEFKSANDAAGKLVSDSTWRVSEVTSAGWELPSYNDAGWRFAVPKGYPHVIVRPNFAEGRFSWIEH